MFFRLKKTPSGQVLQLIESYRNRTDGKPRQRVIVSLGNANIPVSIQPSVAHCIKDHIHGCTNVFSLSENKEIQKWSDYIIRRIAARSVSSSDAQEETLDGVLLDRIGHETVSELGPELAGLHAWRQLGFDECLKGSGFSDLQCKHAAVTVINRLVASVSEHRLEEWVAQTALPELLGEDVLRRGDDHYYRISDKLLSHQKFLEAHIRNRQNTLFSLDRSVLLYNLTNTHFEGLCKRNPKAKHGINKQKRNDCRQVVIGMVFDGSGFELGHKVFEGNQSDSKSLLEMIEALDHYSGRHCFGKKADGLRPVVILDGGIASRANLELLRKNGFSYLVNDSRRGRVNYENDFSDKDIFEPVHAMDSTTPQVMVRTIEEHHKEESENNTREYTERVVLCRSELRGQKEQAIISNAEKRFLNDLEKLLVRIKNGKLIDKNKVERAVGRIQSRHSRIQRYYEIEVHEEKNRTVNIVWKRNDIDFEQASKLHGCYVLRTDIGTLTNIELWKLYITLTRAEEGFQALKRDLGLRPNRHHKEERVDGHIFISVLAYQLMCYIKRKLEDNGDHRDWDTIRRVLRTHCYTTMILPTKNKTVYRIRKASQPEQCQMEIYKTLGVNWKDLPCIKTKYGENQ